MVDEGMVMMEKAMVSCKDMEGRSYWHYVNIYLSIRSHWAAFVRNLTPGFAPRFASCPRFTAHLRGSPRLTAMDVGGALAYRTLYHIQ